MKNRIVRVSGFKFKPERLAVRLSKQRYQPLDPGCVVCNSWEGIPARWCNVFMLIPSLFFYENLKIGKKSVYCGLKTTPLEGKPK